MLTCNFSLITKRREIVLGCYSINNLIDMVNIVLGCHSINNLLDLVNIVAFQLMTSP